MFVTEQHPSEVKPVLEAGLVLEAEAPPVAPRELDVNTSLTQPQTQLKPKPRSASEAIPPASSAPMPTRAESPWQSREPEVTTQEGVLPDTCWVIGVEPYSGDGKLWPTYKHQPTGKVTWSRPKQVSVSDAAAAYERAVQQWFERKRQTDPEEAKRQEKVGIVRNFTWPIELDSQKLIESQKGHPPLSGSQ